MKLHKILPRLYQRGEFYDIKDRISILDELNIRAVINLVPRLDMEVMNHMHWYAHYPIADGNNVDRELVYQLAYYGALLYNEGLGVLTHCHAGRNRSGFVNALIVMEILQIPGKEAMEWIRSKRPNAIANPAFEEILTSLVKLEDLL